MSFMQIKAFVSGIIYKYKLFHVDLMKIVML